MLMSRSERIVALAFLILMMVICWSLWARAEDKKSLTDSQKLSIRSAQVEFLSAQQAAQSTPQYQAMVAAQAKLNDAVQKALKEAGIDQNKFQLQGDLSLIELKGSAPTSPKPEKK